MGQYDDICYEWFVNNAEAILGELFPLWVAYEEYRADRRNIGLVRDELRQLSALFQSSEEVANA
jgi:hypothetical protein